MKITLKSINKTLINDNNNNNNRRDIKAYNWKNLRFKILQKKNEDNLVQ